jgi:hypothetical protein
MVIGYWPLAFLLVLTSYVHPPGPFQEPGFFYYVDSTAGGLSL